MTPASVTFDYRSQIIDNCEFLGTKDDFVSIITAQDAIGVFKAYAVRSNEESRSAFLSSNPRQTVLQAIESLHEKSCEAVHRYISTNGFLPLTDFKETKIRFENNKKDENNDNDDDTASVVSGRSASSTVALSYWGSSDDEANMTPASSADPHVGCREASTEKSNNIGRRRSKPVSLVDKQTRESRPKLLPEFDDSDDDERQRPLSLPLHVKLVSPIRSPPSMNNTSYRPPPPPPGWTGPPVPPPMRGWPIPTHQSQPSPRFYQQPSPRQPMPPSLPPPVGPSPTHGVPAAPATGPCPVTGPMRGATIAPSISCSSLRHKAAYAVSNNPNGGSGNGLVTTFPSHQQQHHQHQHPQHQHQHQHHQHQPQHNGAATTATATAAAAAHLYDVRLTILWIGHGEQRVLESSRASVRALQEMALAYVRTHADAFSSHGGGNENNHVWATTTLRARLRRAFFGPEAYDMTAYRGDDLTRLFAVLSAAGIPRFEVEVKSVPAQIPPAMPVQGREGHAN
ncbi:hypothetical protein AAE478_002992 [Parahypoxylon ruwenzoriense]